MLRFYGLIDGLFALAVFLVAACVVLLAIGMLFR